MAQNEIHVGDVGTQFTLSIYDENSNSVSVSGATATINFKKPDSTIVSKNATVGASSISYISATGDLDSAGTWSLQGYINFGVSGWYTDIQKFQVYHNLCGG